MLRAYANRAMFLAILFAVIALSSLGFAIYVRIQPPTVIRVDKDGNAVVVGGGARQDRTVADGNGVVGPSCRRRCDCLRGCRADGPGRQSRRAAVPRTLPLLHAGFRAAQPCRVAEHDDQQPADLHAEQAARRRYRGQDRGRPHHLGSPNSLDRAHQERAVGITSCSGSRKCTR